MAILLNFIARIAKFIIKLSVIVCNLSFHHNTCLVLLLLKKNYTRLCHCLPKDYKITIDKLKQFMHGSFSDYMAELKILPSNELINEAIVGDLISNVTKDQGMSVFCDIMKMLCHDDSSRNFIDTLRNGMYVVK